MFNSLLAISTFRDLSSKVLHANACLKPSTRITQYPLTTFSIIPLISGTVIISPDLTGSLSLIVLRLLIALALKPGSLSGPITLSLTSLALEMLFMYATRHSIPSPPDLKL